MKKLTIILTLAALAVFTQCKKQELNEINAPIEQGGGIQMVLNADNGGSKTIIGANGAISWKTQEIIYVVANGKCVGHVTNGSSGGNTFWGTLNGITSSGTYDFHFYYIGNKGNVMNNNNYLISNGATAYTMEFSNQDGTLANLGDFHVGYGLQAGVVVTQGEIVNTHATMRSLVSMAYFDIANMAEPGEMVYFYGDNINNKLRLDFSTNIPVYSKINPGKDNYICAGTVTEGSTSPCYVMLLPNHTDGTEELPTDFTFVSQRTIGTCNGVFNYGIVGGRFYCNGGNTDEPIAVSASYQEGIIRGEFSVSATKKVRFSQGNLQYIGSATSPYWKFGDNQWDRIEEGQNTNNSACDRDLFGWGTSGYNHGAICYEPWSTSTTNTEYYAYGNKAYNLYDQTGQADWGYNAISNGGNTENYGWYTLTQPEWDYLFNTRSTTSGIRWANATIKVSHVIVPNQQVYVDNISGLILLPDDWDESYYSLNSPNTIGGTNNTMYSSTWISDLQVHGAVFIPRNGYRRGFTVYGNANGYYWSSSLINAQSAYAVGFSSNSFGAATTHGRCEGLSVRLVYPIE